MANLPAAFVDSLRLTQSGRTRSSWDQCRSRARGGLPIAGRPGCSTAAATKVEKVIVVEPREVREVDEALHGFDDDRLIDDGQELFQLAPKLKPIVSPETSAAS